MATVVPVGVRAKADDAGPPHPWLLLRNALAHGDEDLAVRQLPGTGPGCEVRIDARARGFGLGISHRRLLIQPLALKRFCIHHGARLPILAVGNDMHPVSTAARYLPQRLGQHGGWLVRPASLGNCKGSQRLALPGLLYRRKDVNPLDGWRRAGRTCEEKERWYCQRGDVHWRFLAPRDRSPKTPLAETSRTGATCRGYRTMEPWSRQICARPAALQDRRQAFPQGCSLRHHRHPTPACSSRICGRTR